MTYRRAVSDITEDLFLDRGECAGWRRASMPDRRVGAHG